MKCVKQTGDSPQGQPGTLTVTVYKDANSNQQKDGTETGVGQVDVTVENASPAEHSSEEVTTDSSGTAKAADLYGTYTVTLNVPEDYSATTPTQQTVAVNGNAPTVTFGLKAIGGSAAAASAQPTASPDTDDSASESSAKQDKGAGPLASIPVVNELPETGQFGLLGVLTTAIIAGAYYGIRYLRHRRQS